jgi:alkylation response protein AidB-like acyl-CoA dehydrogenase
MRYIWSEEQRLLRSTLQRYLTDRHSFTDRRRRAGRGFDAGAWAGLADLGLLGVPFPEELGGGGGSALDMLIVMEQLGRALVTEPYVPTVVLGGGLLRHGGNAEQKGEFIPGLIAGEMRFAFAFAEARSRFNLANVSTEAQPARGGFLLSGQKIVVYGAPDAHAIFVTARTTGEPRDRQGVSLFLVSKDAPGLSMRTYITTDGMSAADIGLREVWVPETSRVGELDGALPLVEQVVDEATVAVCAEAVGAMEALNERCVEYCKTRQAFGETLSKFQVLRHRLVDMHLAHELAGAITLKAGLAITCSAEHRARMVSACKVQVGQEAALVGKNAVHLHGAIGMTEELDVGHYFKRLTLIQTMFGNVDHHLRRYVRHTGSAPARATSHGS